MASPDPTSANPVPEQEAADVEAAASLADTPEAYAIPRELAQATLNYLAAQPYREVFALVQGFEALEPLPKSAPSRNGSE
jgi:hypothetical protein